MADYELTVAAMRRIFKKAGAERVSHEAAEVLAIVLECIGIELAKEAIDYAMHAGRKTVKANDLWLAARAKVIEKALTKSLKGPFC